VANCPIDIEQLRRELIRPGALWRQLDHLPETGSTNADLAIAARSGTAEPGTVLLTDYQSAGRGRLGRTWTAPPGTSIAMSVLVRPDGVEPARWTWLPLLTGLAVADGLSRAAGIEAGLKWPNDVLIGDRKVCGILAERVETPDGAACVVGMGINTSLGPEDLPVPTATFVAMECAAAGRPVPSRTDLVATVLAAYELLFRRWVAAPGDPWLIVAYRRRSATLGRTVRVVLGPDEAVEGTATDLDADGRLVLRTSGATRIFGAGDVIHVR
jgi:BirA family transcriptional regulator, biotin operon repressor / biotin---[acetyl-CoA-carboxylase] ligase